MVLPTPLEDDVHLRWFDDPATCATLCATLLDAPDVRERLEREARAYYGLHVDPEATIRRHLREAEAVLREGASDGSEGA